MNKHGQSLIVFVLILPIIVFFIAFFIDSSMMLMENSRLKGLTKDNILIAINEDMRDSTKIKEVMESNKDLNVDIIMNENDLKITVTSQKKNVFGNIFKIKALEQKISYCGNYESKEINKC